ncbi:MAG: SRPBCC family protein [Novosphingobium sp.]|nr:SRPBCC family protein [Novosphingobium sp.]
MSAGSPGGAVPVIAAGTNKRFFHEVATTASPEAVWRQWMDVANWRTWDQGLQNAAADKPLALGVRGKIVDRSGRVSNFTVTEFVPGKSYAFATGLPGARLVVRRVILTDGAMTRFRHEVHFEGLLAGIFASKFGPDFRAKLPPTMQALAARAERGAQ